MSLELDHPGRTAGAWRFSAAIWVGLVALLPIEVLALMVRHDTGALAAEPGWRSALLAQAPQFLQMAIVVVVATLLLGGQRLWGELRRIAAQAQPSLRIGAWLLGHLAAFGAFAALSEHVLGGFLRSSASPGAWFTAWAAAGLASLVLWGTALVPAGTWGPLTRSSAGALLKGTVVGLVAWRSAQFTGEWWRPLCRSTFWVVRGLLSLITDDVVCQPAKFIVSTPTFEVRIAPSCSGFEGIGLIWVLLGVYFWIARRTLRFPRAFLLLPLGTLIIWLANAVRIAALVVVGTWWSSDVAAGGFHSQAGWLAFNAVSLSLIALAQRASFFSRVEASPAASAGADPTIAYLAPMFAIIATTMITGALAHGFDPAYPARVLGAVVVLWACRRGYAGLRWDLSWEAVAIGVAVFVLWMALEPVRPDDANGAEIARGLRGLSAGWAAVWLGARVLGSVLTVPLAEELAFRGYLTRRLIARDFTEVPAGRFTWVSFLVSSLLFGAMHGRWLAGVLAGMAYALALYRRGRLADSVVAHATTNALIAASVLISENFALWA